MTKCGWRILSVIISLWYSTNVILIKLEFSSLLQAQNYLQATIQPSAKEILEAIRAIFLQVSVLYCYATTLSFSVFVFDWGTWNAMKRNRIIFTCLFPSAARVFDTFLLFFSISDPLAFILRAIRHRFNDGVGWQPGRNSKENPVNTDSFATIKQQGRCLQVGCLNVNLAYFILSYLWRHLVVYVLKLFHLIHSRCQM